MPARVWIGLWTSLFILIIVIFNLSALVKYITRFTEESFATLIAVIFIVEAFKKLFQIETDYPVNFDPDVAISTNCSCIAPNCSALAFMTTTTMDPHMTDNHSGISFSTLSPIRRVLSLWTSGNLSENLFEDILSHDYSPPTANSSRNDEDNLKKKVSTGTKSTNTYLVYCPTVNKRNTVGVKRIK